MKRCDESEKMRRDAAKIRRLFFDFVPMRYPESVPRLGHGTELSGLRSGTAREIGFSYVGPRTRESWY